jgi:hypothetical protein
MFMIQQQNAPQSHNIKIADKCFEKWQSSNKFVTYSNK